MQHNVHPPVVLLTSKTAALKVVTVVLNFHLELLFPNQIVRNKPNSEDLFKQNNQQLKKSRAEIFVQKYFI